MVFTSKSPKKIVEKVEKLKGVSKPLREDEVINDPIETSPAPEKSGFKLGAKGVKKPFKAKEAVKYPKNPTQTPNVKNSRKKVTAIKFDSDGDSIHEYEDDSDEKVKKNCKKESSTEAKAAKHKLNVIDPKNQPSGEDHHKESIHESDDDDGIPVITIPLGKVLDEYYKKLREQAASSEYSYENQKSREPHDINENVMKQIRKNVLDLEENDDFSEEL